MNLDKELLIKAFGTYDFPLKDEQKKVTDKSIAFFKEIGLSNELIDFFREFSFKYKFQFGEGNSFQCVNKIRTENIDTINKEIYKKKLLIIGSGKNGDPIVLNLKTMKMGYIFHDKLWENSIIENLESLYVNLDLSIGEFYYKSVTEDNFPIDAYDATDYINKMQ